MWERLAVFLIRSSRDRVEFGLAAALDVEFERNFQFRHINLDFDILVRTIID